MDTSKNPANYSNLTQYGSWIVIGVVLLAGGQFDSTAELSAAMAYLILVAVALWYGPAALKNINSFIGTKSSPTDTTVTRPNIGGTSSRGV